MYVLYVFHEYGGPWSWNCNVSSENFLARRGNHPGGRPVTVNEDMRVSKPGQYIYLSIVHRSSSLSRYYGLRTSPLPQKLSQIRWMMHPWIPSQLCRRHNHARSEQNCFMTYDTLRHLSVSYLIPCLVKSIYLKGVLWRRKKERALWDILYMIRSPYPQHSQSAAPHLIAMYLLEWQWRKQQQATRMWLEKVYFNQEDDLMMKERSCQLPYHMYCQQSSIVFSQ